MPEKQLDLTIRPARKEDTPDVKELTKDIWEGHDYVPDVWPEWLSDPHGRLLVAEHEDKVIGLGKLSLLAPGQWWLEGLRTHPEYEGRGVASRLHDNLVRAWEEAGDGVLRLATASFRQSVQHLCERTGFEKIGEFTPFKADALNDRPGDFRPLTVEEAEKAVAFCKSSSSIELTYGLIDLIWQFVSPTIEHIQQAIQSTHAWWWRGNRGFLSINTDVDDGEPWQGIRAIACSLEDLVECLEDYRRLSGGLGYEKAVWFAALRPELQPALEAAGFERTWEHSVFVYDRKHPQKP